tara:strand:+ start:929 stop:2257 length:1329 start_codon:yes stop_codon:yes gene_type:complete
MGLNEDLTKQVIVPLLAILDKHGKKFVDPESPTTQTINSFAHLAAEFGPLIQGAYQYFSGVKMQLDAADAELLEANAAALSASELNTLFGNEDDVVVAHETEVATPQESEGERPHSFGPDGRPFESAPVSILEAGKVDYYALLGNNSSTSQGSAPSETDIYRSQQQTNEQAQQNSSWKTLPAKSSGIVSVEELAAENALSPQEVKRSDNHQRSKGGDPTDVSINLMGEEAPRVVDEGKKEILSAMRSETDTRKMWSKDPAEATPTMSAEDLVAHIKSQAKPGQGGQTATDAHSMKKPSTVTGFENAAKTAFDIPAAQSLVANAFNIPGLDQAIAEEKGQRAEGRDSQTFDSPTDGFIEELEGARAAEQTSLQAESEIDFKETESTTWEIGSLEDLSPSDLEIEGIELEIEELDVSLSEEAVTADPDAKDTTPKRNQFRSSTL